MAWEVPEMMWWWSASQNLFPLKTKGSFKSDDTISHFCFFSKSQMNFAEAIFSENFQHIRSDSQWFAMVTRDERSPGGVSRSFPMVSRSCLDHFSTCEKDLVVFISWYLQIICIHMYDLFYVYTLYIFFLCIYLYLHIYIYIYIHMMKDKSSNKPCQVRHTQFLRERMAHFGLQFVWIGILIKY